MRPSQFPILEFDPARKAVIEPSEQIRPRDVPKHCVPCFFQDVIDGLIESRSASEVACMKSEMGRHPLYEIEMNGRRLAVYQPGLTAPFAAAMLDEVIAYGCRKFIACGGAGVLNSDVAVGHIVVPLSAVRDEGASYHYVAPSREVEAGREGVAAIERVLRAHGRGYVVGKTWTTDAFYRETPAKVALRRSEGCVTVEMEAAAFFAVARFRGVQFAQMLYGGDDVSGHEWDSRKWNGRASVREDLFWLAAEACLLL
ncbi:MAG: nucleoside phosphorylase [Candidatus Eisenbacteria bacterium]|nr:nucleoside phosphorylase [Candidatus Eisenbacteria bacterium]